MLRLPSYLQKRSDRYYFRQVVPEAVRPGWPGREVKHSLRTTDRVQAIRSARVLVLYLEELYEGVAMGTLTHQQARTLLQGFLKTELAKLTRYLELRGPLPVEKKLRIDEHLRTASAVASLDVATPYGEQLAGQLIREKRLAIEQGSPGFERLALDATRMSITLMREFLAASDGLAAFRVKPDRAPEAGAPEALDIAGDQALPLSKLIDIYCAEKRREGSWTDKTEYSNRGMFSLLLKIVGDPPINRVDAATARRYKTIMQKLPGNLEKNPAYRGLTIPEVLAMKPKDLMSVTTINNNLTKVASLFGWAERNGYIERNHFTQLTLRNPQRADEARAPFTEEDLRNIFSTAQYRNHKFLHPHYYWLPLLGLHTGARISELCQLDLDDIRQEQGVWVIDINAHGEHKQLKTKAAKRLVPIHPKLLELGLLDFVKQQRDRGHARLFAELPVRRDGASQSASLWFGRYRDKLGLYNQKPKKDFHSFRTTLINTLKQRGVPEPEVATLVGHAIDSMTYGRYGKPYTPEFLLNMIKTVDFAGVLGCVQKWRN